MSEQEFLGDAAPYRKVPTTELEATKLEADAELDLTLALTAQQMGDWRKARAHTRRADRAYLAIESAALNGVEPGGAAGSEATS